jgi:Ca-activated chloride channel homolog
MISFTNPFVLVFLLIVPLIAYLYFLAFKKKKSSAIKFSNVSLIKSAMGDKKHNIRKHLSLYFSLAIILLMVIGFADPHIPLKQVKQGVNVVLAIDVSGSMQATDYQPTRLEAAKRSAKILIESLHVNDNVGIVLFESGATTSSYLTPLKKKALLKLEGIAPKDGRTAIGDGLALAVDMVTSIPNKKKLVILLSDGVNNAGVISPEESVAYANANKIQVYTIGMGSDQPVVLGHDWFGNPQYAELDESTLMAIAESTKAEYFKSVNGDTLDDIYETISKEIEREKEPTSIKNWFFVLALILLLVQLYVQYGKYRIIA